MKISRALLFLGLATLTSALPKGEQVQQREKDEQKDTRGVVGIQGGGKKVDFGSPNAFSLVSKMRRLVVCEGQVGRFFCTNNGHLNIHYANYGRTQADVCGYKGPFMQCLSSRAVTLFQVYCQHRSSCLFQAANSVFGDPCVGIPKYVEIIFSCFKV